MRCFSALPYAHSRMHCPRALLRTLCPAGRKRKDPSGALANTGAGAALAAAAAAAAAAAEGGAAPAVAPAPPPEYQGLPQSAPTALTAHASGE